MVWYHKFSQNFDELIFTLILDFCQKNKNPEDFHPQMQQRVAINSGGDLVGEEDEKQGLSRTLFDLNQIYEND